MKKTYNSLNSIKWLGLAAALLVSAPAAHAQFGYNIGGVSSDGGTYTDLGSNGTVIITSSTDDANSAAQNIGFNFIYNGITFTQFVLNTNGLVRLGSAAPSKAAACSPYAQAPDLGPINSTDPADVNLIMPFNFDLIAGTSAAEYRVYTTTGTAGSRVCTIQWKNVADKPLAASATTSTVLATQFTNFAFQVKLYEGTNKIEFVYSAPAVGAAAITNAKFSTVGIKGSKGDIGSDIIGIKPSATAWSDAAFYTLPQPVGVNGFNFRQSMPPDAGRTFSYFACTPTTITTFPYTENFNSVAEGALPCGATGSDANSDLYTWDTADFGGGDIALYYSVNTTNTAIAANDWYYTPGLSLRTGYTYQLQFDYAVADAANAEALEVKWGNANTPTGQTTTLFSNNNITNDNFATTTTSQVAIIRPTVAGIYYIGFHAVSAANRKQLVVDNIQVTETRVLGVKNSTNTLFSAEASPVPFGSSLTLSLNTVQAGDLHLTMRDVLGRTLRQTTAKVVAGSNSIAVPEVASLPAGIYLLDVEQAGQKQVLRVTHE